jgi:penicillin-binding protein 2
LTGELPHRDESVDYYGPRIRVAVALMLACIAVLAGRLWQLQTIKGEWYTEMSKSNRMRWIRIPPSRGRILDCTGRVLAENRPSFTLSILPAELQNPQDVIDACSSAIGLAPETMRGIIERSRSVPRFTNYPIKKNMTLEEVSLVKAHATDLKGVYVETKPVRRYPLGETLCHELGTLGEISPAEVRRLARQGYRTGDMVGKSGIEKEYEKQLRGEEGWEQIEIDARGRQLGTVSRKPAPTGQDVYLTVDADLQRFAEEIFIHRAGSIVAVDPDTGRILAAVSKPGYDLNLFSPSITDRQWKKLNSDPLHPLENRTIRGLYPPASTFKVVTATAGLAEGVVSPSKTFTCKGEMDLWGNTFRCWNRYGHGKMDLHRAIIESCDIYFYQLGLKVGVDRLARYASLFGLGKPTGLGLPHELPGLVPTPAWKLRTYGDSWEDGETVNFSIGQGYLAATPIQLAMMTAVLANGGKLLKPSIIRRIDRADGTTVYNHVPTMRWPIPLDPEKQAVLRNAMTSVVEDAKGTGRKCRIAGINIAAKTGTSQVIREKHGGKGGLEIPYHERTHAIFIAYVDDRPQKIALAVIVEHGGGGGANAGPLARKIIARYYGMRDPGDGGD